MKYNYFGEMKADVKTYIEDNYSINYDSGTIYYNEESEEITLGFDELYEDMWISDSVTGNASGSYYCNAWKAEEALNHNWDLLEEALDGFGCEGVDIIEKGPEWCDAVIRCYLLGQVLAEVLEEYEEEAEQESEAA